MAGTGATYAEEPLVRYGLYVIGLAREVVDRLKVLPGRKMLFVLSGVLEISGPDYEIVGQQAKALVEDANRAGVTIYGINPSGLETPRSEALGFLAAETGGTTIERTGFPAGDLDTILEMNRGYYLIGYNPGDAPSTLARRIKVHVRREGLNVAARPQVYAKTALTADAAPDGVKPALETLLNAPLATGAIRVRLTPYVRWTRAKAGEFLAVVDIDPNGVDVGPDPQSRTVDLDVVARVSDQQGRVLKAHRVRITQPLNETGPDPLHFVVRAALPSPGFYQADVAVHDNRNGQRGNATGVASLLDLSDNKRPFLASTLAMTSGEPAGANPEQRFRQGSVVTLSCVVANARRARGREAQIEIRMRIMRDGQAVLEMGPEVLRKQLPELIDVKGKVSLRDLAPGEYVAEVRLTDLLGEKGRNAVTISAPFSVAETVQEP